VRVFIGGCKGQVGSDLMRLLADDPRVTGFQGMDVDELDLTDAAAVRRVLADQKAATDRLVVINCSAWNNVDGAEEQEAAAYAVNATAPANLAAACAELGARLIHISTDYVFPGDGTRPYEVDDEPGPSTAYGRTKRAGELAVRTLHPDDSYVVRTAWVYGQTGHNFVKTIVRAERVRETLTVVDDQRGCPTWSKDLAKGLLELAFSDVTPGILHATGAGDTTWCQFARAIFEEIGADPARVHAVTTAEYGNKTPRPAYSVLSLKAWDAAGLPPMQEWRSALAAAFAEARDAFTVENQ
jgi:dTDP-4-dehydrorhamnose reductase